MPITPVDYYVLFDLLHFVIPLNCTCNKVCSTQYISIDICLVYLLKISKKKMKYVFSNRNLIKVNIHYAEKVTCIWNSDSGCHFLNFKIYEMKIKSTRLWNIKYELFLWNLSVGSQNLQHGNTSVKKCVSNFKF